MAKIRIVFMGTPDLARASLEALLASPQFEVVAAVTQPDRPKGRDLKLQPSPVKHLSLAAGLPVLQPERARDETFISQLREFSPDLIAVAAFGQILPRALLDLPRHGCLNVHTSLLPKYRGAAPIQWAILNDEPETGVTIMKMDVGLDTGPILTHEKTAILPQDNSQTLHDRLAKIGADLLVRTIPDYTNGNIHPTPQPTDGVSLARKIQKQDGRLDWTQPARILWNRVRGLVPWPGAFTRLPDSSLLKIWAAETAAGSGQPGEILRTDKQGILVASGRDALLLSLVQLEGGRRLTAAEFLAGHPLNPGQRLG